MNKTFGVHHQNLSTADELIYFHVAYINFIATGILRISETNDQCVLIKDQSWVYCVDIPESRIHLLCDICWETEGSLPLSSIMALLAHVLLNRGR